MAVYKGREVTVERIVPRVDTRFQISSKELGTKTVNKSELIFTEAEKEHFLKQEQEEHSKHTSSSYKTKASEEKRIAHEKLLADKHQAELAKKSIL